ncbi:MAG: CocE/NonD family hydrolase [Planctomycetota bacterium]|nr:CocE/NonD family hydrolase [Planctomycetota bacterium]
MTTPLTSSASPSSPPASAFGIVLSKDVMLPMRDGLRLATDLYRPARDGEPLPGPFPAILCRTPYDKTDRRYAELADLFTPRGYVVALQDMRDRYRSEGSGDYEHTATPHEGRDGYDTVEWLASRPWSNGKVGMVGSSFAAVTQARAALERPPHLAAIWPDVTPTNNFHHQTREGGAMQLQMFWALFVHAQDSQDIRHDPAKQAEVWNDLRDMRKLLLGMPWRPGQLSLRHTPKLEQTLFNYYTRGRYDAWWAEERNDYTAHFHRHADIPATFSTGWYDAYTHAMTGYFSAMAAKNRTPQRLVVGPWSHVGMRGDSPFLNDVDFGPSSAWGVSRYFEEQLRFFDRWLKGIDNGIERDPPVRLFVMGGGTGRRTPEGRLDHGGAWRSEREWPLARARPTPYCLHADGTLSPAPPHDADASRSFTFDPLNPVPSIGGSLCAIMELPAPAAAGNVEAMWTRFLNPVLRLRNLLGPGPYDQHETANVFGAHAPYRRLRDRDDVLVFQTPPLPEPLEVTGPIAVHLWVASTATDTDFTAKLIDAYPPSEDYPEGFDLNLCDSIIRCRYREGWDREVPMEPSKPCRVTITLPPTSNLFARGHRLRLDISSSNFPRLDVNPNTGEPVGQHTHTQPATNTVFCDPTRPSHVVVPVV